LNILTAKDVGGTAIVRSRRFLIEEVEESPHGPVAKLSCLEDDAQGEELEVFWDAEIDARVQRVEQWDSLSAKGFDDPKLFSAYFHALKWNCVTATDPRIFHAPFRAGIQLHAYQLEPLRKSLLMPRVNLFIADDVGLGKTIEAGLIARELLARRKIREIVVCCPPSVSLQWQEEMSERFGLQFEILDMAYLAKVRQERGHATNPWRTHSRFILSHSLLRDENYATPMREWLGEFLPGSLLVLDEAHHAAPASGSKYAVDSQFTRAVRDLSHRFEHRLFLSATPHNGHSNSFSALLEILDPQRFCRGVEISGKKELEKVMVRRLKEDLRQIEGGFPERIVSQETISGLPESAPDLELPRLLEAYALALESRLAGQSERLKASAKLILTGLQQRMLSSTEAFAKTLRVHRNTLIRKGWQPAPEPLENGPNPDDQEWEEEYLAQEDDLPETASTDASMNEGSSAPITEIELLDRMQSVAQQGRSQPDARVKRLLHWIKENLCPGLSIDGSGSGRDKAAWLPERVLIFTEYTDTVRYLEQQLSGYVETTDRGGDRIAVFTGQTSREKRQDMKTAFNGDPEAYPLRILIANDAAREGINLQNHCRHVFHFDLPWNPSKLEQRNGRIDRKLQRADKVYCHYFFYSQREEDRVLKALVQKTQRIYSELGSLSKILDADITGLFQSGIRKGTAEAMAARLEALEPEAARKQAMEQEFLSIRGRREELQDQVDRLRKQLADSQAHAGFHKDHFRETLQCALGMLNVPPLEPIPLGKEITGYRFPDLQSRDTSWIRAMDGLRPPRPREARKEDWRREQPLRPIMFEDPGNLDDKAVHIHLEHRVVQRLLGRFTSQGFVYHDLSRACIAQSEDAIPRVVLLARLSLYGKGSARLHEELVSVAARWIDPDRRKSKTLFPFGDAAEERALGLLEEGLLRPRQQHIPTQVQTRLRGSGPGDVDALLPSLTEKAEAAAEIAKRKLAARGEAEAKAMGEILAAQKERIRKQYDLGMRADSIQLDFFPEIEKRQFEANLRHWKARLGELDREIQAEPQRILEQYEILAQRIEPIGLAYLWPITG
jgi:SNF2 family DNA or RNA helicase